MIGRRLAPRHELHGHIPAFRGFDQAVERLFEEPLLVRATTVFLDIHGPQGVLHQRLAMLGKRVVACIDGAATTFAMLDPNDVPRADLMRGGDSEGLRRLANPVPIDQLPPIDLALIGSVAADIAGGRIGDGSGAGDLAYARLREAGCMSIKTPIVTLIHSVQLLQSALPMERHDVPVDLIFTEESRMLTHASHRRPACVYTAATPRDGLPDPT